MRCSVWLLLSAVFMVPLMRSEISFQKQLDSSTCQSEHPGRLEFDKRVLLVRPKTTNLQMKGWSASSLISEDFDVVGFLRSRVSSDQRLASPGELFSISHGVLILEQEGSSDGMIEIGGALLPVLKRVIISKAGQHLRLVSDIHERNIPISEFAIARSLLRIADEIVYSWNGQDAIVRVPHAGCLYFQASDDIYGISNTFQNGEAYFPNNDEINEIRLHEGLNVLAVEAERDEGTVMLFGQFRTCLNVLETIEDVTSCSNATAQTLISTLGCLCYKCTPKACQCLECSSKNLTDLTANCTSATNESFSQLASDSTSLLREMKSEDENSSASHLAILNSTVNGFGSSVISEDFKSVRNISAGLTHLSPVTENKNEPESGLLRTQLEKNSTGNVGAARVVIANRSAGSEDVRVNSTALQGNSTTISDDKKPILNIDVLNTGRASHAPVFEQPLEIESVPTSETRLQNAAENLMLKKTTARVANDSVVHANHSEFSVLTKPVHRAPPSMNTSRAPFQLTFIPPEPILEMKNIPRNVSQIGYPIRVSSKRLVKSFQIDHEMEERVLFENKTRATSSGITEFRHKIISFPQKLNLTFEQDIPFENRTKAEPATGNVNRERASFEQHASKTETVFLDLSPQIVVSPRANLSANPAVRTTAKPVHYATTSANKDTNVLAKTTATPFLTQSKKFAVSREPKTFAFSSSNRTPTTSLLPSKLPTVTLTPKPIPPTQKKSLLPATRVPKIALMPSKPVAATPKPKSDTNTQKPLPPFFSHDNLSRNATPSLSIVSYPLLTKNKTMTLNENPKLVTNQTNLGRHNGYVALVSTILGVCSVAVVIALAVAYRKRIFILVRSRCRERFDRHDEESAIELQEHTTEEDGVSSSEDIAIAISSTSLASSEGAVVRNIGIMRMTSAQDAFQDAVEIQIEPEEPEVRRSNQASFTNAAIPGCSSWANERARGEFERRAQQGSFERIAQSGTRLGNALREAAIALAAASMPNLSENVMEEIALSPLRNFPANAQQLAQNTNQDRENETAARVETVPKELVRDGASNRLAPEESQPVVGNENDEQGDPTQAVHQLGQQQDVVQQQQDAGEQRPNDGQQQQSNAVQQQQSALQQQQSAVQQQQSAVQQQQSAVQQQQSAVQQQQSAVQQQEQSAVQQQQSAVQQQEQSAVQQQQSAVQQQQSAVQQQQNAGEMQETFADEAAGGETDGQEIRRSGRLELLPRVNYKV